MLSDPLHAYALPGRVTGTDRPLPLIATKFAIRLDRLLATVTTTRVFRNAETQSIEATMTIPAPVHATVLGLRAQIGERVVTGSARRKHAARETYEAAIDDGRTAILHEEVLRGVHLISVGHIPPGAEITVDCLWAMPLSVSGVEYTLRIPVTVGDVYGRSPLPDSDALVHGGPAQMAEITLSCPGVSARLVGHGALQEGVLQRPLDAPIELMFTGCQFGPLHGVAADGRAVSLTIRPAPGGDAPIEAAVVADRSGSMAERATGYDAPSKLDIVHAALAEQAARVTRQDRIELWQFDDDAERVGGRDFAGAVAAMGGTRGGTRIGPSLDTVLAGWHPRDVLLITDGKSYDIDVQALAATGCRFQVALVGEDSLEAQVGHLAALTGGELFVTTGDAAGSAIGDAFAAMRRPKAEWVRIVGKPCAADALIGGMAVQARWGEEATPDSSALSRAVAAVAASLAIPRMPKHQAALLAEAEGLVCHLTSLVLVDQDGAAQAGIPAQRKIPTMTPRTAMAVAAPMPAAAPPMAAPTAMPMARTMSAPPAPGSAGGGGGWNDPPVSRPRSRSTFDTMRSWFAKSPGTALVDWHGVRGCIDWARDPDALRTGDFSALPAAASRAIAAASRVPAVAALAARLGIAAPIVALALLARAESDRHRAADRIARAVLGAVPAGDLDALAAAIGL